MIRVTITEAEYVAAIKSLDGYQPEDVRDYASAEKVRTKLHEADEFKQIRFTNKEANVLMDALNEIEADEAETLFEKLTGRTS